MGLVSPKFLRGLLVMSSCVIAYYHPWLVTTNPYGLIFFTLVIMIPYGGKWWVDVGEERFTSQEKVAGLLLLYLLVGMVIVHFSRTTPQDE